MCYKKIENVILTLILLSIMQNDVAMKSLTLYDLLNIKNGK